MDERTKATYRLPPGLIAQITAANLSDVAVHRGGPERWRRAPSVNDTVERLLNAGLQAAIDRDDATPISHGKKLRAMNAARAPKAKATHKRTIARKAVKK